jgi:dimethylargininase
MQVAITRAVGPALAECALTFRKRESIDVGRAERQHAAYEEALRRHGVQVRALPVEPDLPDAIFVEDTAVVVDELVVLTRPGLESRRREVASVAAALKRYRPLARIDDGASLEGGDVLRIDRTLYAGLSCRTDAAGAAALARVLEPLEYRVVTVPVTGCLHLKTAITQVAPGTLLLNPAWIDPAPFARFELIAVPTSEPDAANTLLLGETVLMPASFPRTRELLEARGLAVEAMDVSELQKAEAGVTCCSILFSASGDVAVREVRR